MNRHAPEKNAATLSVLDERKDSPYFSQPIGFQAITLVVDSDKKAPEFIKI
ncbi:hypothetical protein [Candidatus Agathobaculum pullicola]|uniref:hypothetical protein n=1 Tax=Candidatus Agathobaculum pullicola TaxID=2838426 RepID=UPI003F90EFBF